MAKIKVDPKTFLKEVSSLADAEMDAILSKIDTDKLSEMVMRQQDYDRSYSDLTKAKADLQVANDRLNAEMADWAELKNKDSEAGRQMQARIEELTAQSARLQTRLESVATEAGMDVTKVMDGITKVEPPKEPTNQPPAFDPAKAGVVTLEQMGNVVNRLFGNQFDMMAVSADHQALFGKPLTGADLKKLKAEVEDRVKARDPNRPAELSAAWEAAFGVGDERSRQSTEKYQADIKAAEARGREAALSEQALPGAQPPSHGHAHSPLFGGDGKSKLERPAAQGTARTAAAHLRTGTYKGKSIESVKAAAAAK